MHADRIFIPHRFNTAGGVRVRKRSSPTYSIDVFTDTSDARFLNHYRRAYGRYCVCVRNEKYTFFSFFFYYYYYLVEVVCITHTHTHCRRRRARAKYATKRTGKRKIPPNKNRMRIINKTNDYRNPSKRFSGQRFLVRILVLLLLLLPRHLVGRHISRTVVTVERFI